MPIQINCPACKGTVRVPESLLGKRVQCPRCQGTFTAEAIDDEPPPTPRVEAEPAPARQVRRDVSDDDFDDHVYRRPRYPGRPHRGAAVLTLGILSIVLCSPLGIIAWTMGKHDLDAIRRGEIDRDGEGLTQAGMICGIVGTVLLALQCLCGMGYFSLWAAILGRVR